MTPSQIQLVKRSWRLLRELPPAVVADAFYSKLFFDHPALRRMFPENMDEQYKKLMDMLTSMILRLDDLSEIQQDIAELGKRHEGFGVNKKHYAMVEVALLWTLERGLGGDWNEEVAEAWKSCYETIANVMQEALTN